MSQTVRYHNTDYYIRGTGEYQQCERAVKPLLKRDVACAKEPCAMNGVFQPTIDYAVTHFYGFAEFYYCMRDVLSIDGEYDYYTFMKAAAVRNNLITKIIIIGLSCVGMFFCIV